jgi:hypothetical protein
VGPAACAGGLMVAAHVRIAPLDPARHADLAKVCELICAQAGSADRVEHLRARTGPYGIDILAFIDSNDAETAAGFLRLVVNEAIGAFPLLRLWRIV